ncbi:hypothetical protein HANVADRAFT_853 [Hanseniaspora valbyensis NRRL Y-1626]|uniref:DUF1748-domain-containing protein n=1 Tax=Hanseniaspora valbyensis NRRL Y-1626 TaxID=766949 RepID=A0A1B7THM5_9ASCO|nr:hypothetical protein HANVADRAFT_853 [Hanseniaspora valbyensis NRRL Y-1626]
MVTITVGKIVHLSTDLLLISTILSTINYKTGGSDTIKYYLDYYLKLGDDIVNYTTLYLENKRDDDFIKKFFIK